MPFHFIDLKKYFTIDTMKIDLKESHFRLTSLSQSKIGKMFWDKKASISFKDALWPYPNRPNFWPIWNKGPTWTGPVFIQPKLKWFSHNWHNENRLKRKPFQVDVIITIKNWKNVWDKKVSISFRDALWPFPNRPNFWPIWNKGPTWIGPVFSNPNWNDFHIIDIMKIDWKESYFRATSLSQSKIGKIFWYKKGGVTFRDELWPYPNRTNFWPIWNKRADLDGTYIFLTQTKSYFLTRKIETYKL